MDTIGAWAVIGIGVFIVWKAWSWKKNRGNSGVPSGAYIVQVPGAPARKGGGVLLFILVAVAIAFLLFSNWSLKHVPQLPPVR
jgi:hypothetical protein